MPYEARGKCVYKKDGGAKVGCTNGSVKKYLAALHANANESTQPTTDICNGFDYGLLSNPITEDTKDLIKRLIRENLGF